MSLLFNKITLLQEIRALHAIIECNKDCVVTPNVKSAIQPLIDKFNIDINLGTTGNSSFINIRSIAIKTESLTICLNELLSNIILLII